MAAAIPWAIAAFSAGSTVHQISEGNNARRAGNRALRKQQTLLTESEAEVEEQLKAERMAAEQTARNAAATRQRAILASNTSKAGTGGGKSGTLLTGSRGLGMNTLLGR